MKNEDLFRRAKLADQRNAEALISYPTARELFKKRGAHVGLIPTGLPILDQMIVKAGAKVIYDQPAAGGPALPGPYTDQDSGEIHLPYPEAFASMKDYQHILAHEFSHWLAIPSESYTPFTLFDEIFGSQVRPIEELAAECTARKILEFAGSFADKESDSYLKSWIKHAEVFEAQGVRMSAVEAWDASQMKMEARVNFIQQLMSA